jgi:uncharacterized protein YdeI (BOF family)
MRNAPLAAAVLGVAFGICFLAASPGDAHRGDASIARQAVQSAQSKDQDQVKAFTGTIAKNGERFVLRDDSTQILYDLDDQTSAGKFTGRKVRVTGTLDANNTIHVQTIEQASA